MGGGGKSLSTDCGESRASGLIRVPKQSITEEKRIEKSVVDFLNAEFQNGEFETNVHDP